MSGLAGASINRMYAFLELSPEKFRLLEYYVVISDICVFSSACLENEARAIFSNVNVTGKVN